MVDRRNGLEEAGIDLLSYRRLSGPMYEVDPPAKSPPPPPKKANEKPDAGLPKNADPSAKPRQTQGAPSKTRKDPLPASGVDLQTRIKTLAAELKKKYGLPRDNGERPPPPVEPPTQAPAKGPARST